MTPRKNRIGATFGELTVLSYAEKRGHRIRVIAKCTCGVEKEYDIQKLAGGHTKSCGCRRWVPIHGHWNHRNYILWREIKRRCFDTNFKQFKDYGGRGITVCAEWMSYPNFLRDMGICPEGFSIERKNVNGNYEPGNCIWIPRGDQAKNTRRNVWIEFNGERLCANDACKKAGINGNQFRSRMFQAKGFNVTPQEIFDRLLKNPKPQNRIFVKVGGVERVLTYACREFGIVFKSVCQRAKLSGETHQQAFDHFLKRKQSTQPSTNVDDY